MCQLMLQLLCLQEFTLQNRPLDIDIVFKAIQSFFLFVKHSLLLEHLLSFFRKSLTGVLNLGRQFFKHHPLSIKLEDTLLQLLVVCIN